LDGVKISSGHSDWDDVIEIDDSSDEGNISDEGGRMAFEHSQQVIDLTGDEFDEGEEREVLEIIEVDDLDNDLDSPPAHVDIDLTGDED